MISSLPILLCPEEQEEPNTALVEFAQAFFQQTDIHQELNGANDTATAVAFVNTELEGAWSQAGNAFSYNGEAKAIKGNINLKALDNGASSYWSRPQLRVTETVSGRVFWLDGGVVMQENTNYDGSTVMSGSFTHLNPPANANYEFHWFDSERRTATLIPNEDACFIFEAAS